MVYKYREVRGTFTALTPDTTDADEHPNLVPLEGSVVLTPRFNNGGISFAELGHFDQPQVKHAAIEDGELKAVVVDEESGHLTRQALFLPVTDDDNADQTWSYEATFPEVVRTDTGDRVVIPARRFVVEAGDGPLNLAAVATAQTAGAIVTRGVRGPGITDITASDGTVTVEWEGGDDVQIPIPTATLATPTNDGLMGAGDKSKLNLYPDSPEGLTAPDNGAKTASKVALRDGTATVMLMGDSTGNDANEWYRQWIEQLAAETPALRVEYFPWEGTAYRSSPIIVQSGGGPAPSPVGGVVAADSFSRTGELSGSTSDKGAAWTGTAGRWETSGGKAVALGVGTAVLNGGVTSERMTSRASGITMDLTAPSTSQKQFQLHTKYVNSLHHVYGYVNVSTTGLVTWGAFKRINGTVTQIIPPQTLSWSGTHTFDMSITVDGTDVSLTVDGETRAGVLEPSDATLSMSATSLAIMGLTAQTAGTSVESVELEVPVTTPVSSNQVLYAYNASRAGSTLAYQLARLDVMLAPNPDLLILSSGHNYTTGTVEDYLDEVHELVSATKDRIPGIGIAVSSQNAVSPDLEYYQHNIRRNAALRAEAHISGWGYIGGMEAFLDQPDDGAGGLLSDGLHPSTLGSTWWKNAALGYWRSLSPSVGEETSITQDTTVGTRVFAGDVMIHGDTGWRDVPGIADVPTTGTVHILLRRENSTVTLSADRFTPAEAVGTFTKFMTLPPGFRPQYQYRDSGGYESGSVYTEPGGAITTRAGLEAGASARFYIQFVTDDEWPTALPGTPA